MQFSDDSKVRAISTLTDVLFEHVLLPDESPFFVSDEATLLDVSGLAPEELQERCAAYYRTTVSLDDLRRPLWQLLPDLDRRRRAAEEQH